jgi:hypothetical protein
VPLVVALVIVLLLMITMWIAIAKERGPSPADVAVAYERAWSELDFGLLYDLSGDELRDGLRRDQFIAAKRSAYANTEHRARLTAEIEVEMFAAGNETALVVTQVSADGGTVRNNVVLERRPPGWLVVAYSLRPERDAGTAAS